MYVPTPQVIACHYATPEGLAALKPYVPQIWPVLYSHFESLEEGTRNVVAECVGKLTLLDPEILLPKLKVSFGIPPPSDCFSQVTQSSLYISTSFTVSVHCLYI